MYLKPTMRSALYLLLGLVASTAHLSANAAAQNKINLNEVEKTIKKAMKTFEVPGLAVAIVKDNKVVMSKGFGLRKLGKKDPVDANTLFGIASNTKAFTTAALAILVDEGKLNWNDKVSDYLPSFQMSDPYVTRQFTIRDMLSHRSGLGLGAGDLMIWPSTDITNQEIIERIRYLTPVSGFRSEYAYDNLMYVMAGEIVAKASGMSWQDFVRQRILTPLKMNHTRMQYSLIRPDNHNVASAHAPVDGVLAPVDSNFIERFLSAGSMASNVNDMSQWLKLQLNRGYIGTVNGKEKQLFSGAQSVEMWAPNTIQPVKAFNLEMDKTHFKAYGLGWGLSDYHGYKMVAHNGGIMGMVSRVTMIPEVNLGVVVLTNQQSGSAFNAIIHDITNRYLGLPEQDWIAIYHDKSSKKTNSGNNVVAALMQNRDADSTPSLPLRDYAQPYKDNWYGNIDITLVNNKRGKINGDKLEMRFSRTPILVGELEHYQHNTFIVRWYDRSTNADALVNFHLTAEGRVLEVTMKPLSPLTDFSFDFQDLRLQPTLVQMLAGSELH